jgi:hypothetical protein
VLLSIRVKYSHLVQRYTFDIVELRLWIIIIHEWAENHADLEIDLR